jgi:Na+-translocating ferredoxin:NAD+ oxidoreductase subunit G
VRSLCLCLFILTCPGPRSAWALSLQSPEQALKKAFPGAAAFKASGITLTAQQRQDLDKALGRRSLDAYAVRFEALDPAGKLVGSAWMDDEIGKHRPITYLVALDRSQSIVSVEMLTYREAHGLEARSPRFTRQFKGKGSSASLVVGQDLDAISGATLSCRTLAFGAAKALRQEALFQSTPQPGLRPSQQTTTQKEDER